MRLAVLLILSLIMTAPAMFTVSAVAIPIPDDGIQLATNGTGNTTLDNLFDGILGIISSTIQIFVDIILAPFRAIATVFTNWGTTLSGWAGPIIAAFVIIVILVMVRIYGEIDGWFDKDSG